MAQPDTTAPVQYKRHSHSQRRFMIFDVETTGLINRPKKSDPPNQPPPTSTSYFTNVDADI